MTGTALADRVRRLEDLEAINALFLAYVRYLDAKDWRPYSQLFTDDAEFVAGLGTARGPEEIHDLFATRLAGVDAGFHVITNVRIDLDGDRATARSFWMYLCPDEAGWPRILQFGHYDDVLARDGGRWLFKRREAARDVGFPPYRD